MNNNEYKEYDVLNISYIPMDYIPIGIIRKTCMYETLKYIYGKISPYIWICTRRDSELRNTIIVHPGTENITYSSAYRYIDRGSQNQNEIYLLQIANTNKYELYDGRGDGLLSKFEIIWKRGEVSGPGSITISKNGSLGTIIVDKDGVPHLFRSVSTHETHGHGGINADKSGTENYYVVSSLAPLCVPKDYTTNGWYTAIRKIGGKTVLFPMHDFEIRDDDGYIVDELVEKAYNKYP